MNRLFHLTNDPAGWWAAIYLEGDVHDLHLAMHMPFTTFKEACLFLREEGFELSDDYINMMEKEGR